MHHSVHHTVHHVTLHAPPAVVFSGTTALIYIVPVLYAVVENPTLFETYMGMLLMFFIAYFVLYVIWYAHPKANLSGDRVQLLIYQALGVMIVGIVALFCGLLASGPHTATQLFFGLVAMPTLYGVLAVVNYALFVWGLELL